MLLNTAEAGTAGTVANATNTSGLSGDAFIIGGTAATAPTFSTTGAKRGGLGYSIPSDSSNGSLEWTVTAANALSVQVWIKMSAYPTAEYRFFDFRDTTPGTVGGLLVRTTGTVRLMQVTSGLATVTSPVLSLNTWYCIDLWINNTSSGTYGFKVTNLNGTTFYESTGVFASTALPISRVRFGRPTVQSMGGNFYFDDIRADGGRASYITESIIDPPTPNTGNSTAFWNGTTEVSGELSLWNGTTELPVSASWIHGYQTETGFSKLDATKTGATGTLTVYNGNITATAGQTIENLDIYGKVTVQVANVTIRNCRIRGGTAPVYPQNWGIISAYYAGTSNLLVENCTIAPTNISVGWDGIKGHDYTIRGCNIYDVVDGCGVFNTDAPTANSNVVIESNYIHDLVYLSPDPNHTDDDHTHNDGIQIQGNNGTIIRGNTISALCSANSNATSPYYPSVTGQAIGITPNLANGTCTGTIIDQNWIDGGAQSITAIANAKQTTAIITNNIFGRNQPSIAKPGLTADKRPILIAPDVRISQFPLTTDVDSLCQNIYEDNGLPVTVTVYDEANNAVLKPGSTNTGHNGTLTPVYPTGGSNNDILYLTTAGEIYENKEVFGFVVVQAADVIIRNCYVRGPAARGGTLVTASGTACVNLLVENCTLKADYDNIAGIGIHGWHYTARFNNVSNVVDGFGAYYAHPSYTTLPPGNADVIIEKNWVHDLYCDLDPIGHPSDGITHNDCIQLHGGGNVTIRGNNLVANPAANSNFTTSPQGTLTGGMAGVMVTPNVNYGYVNNVLIENNWLDYGTACLNLNATATSGDTTSSVTVLNNKFGRHGARTESTQVADDVMTPYRITVGAGLITPGLRGTDGLDTTNGNVFEDNSHQVMVNRN